MSVATLEAVPAPVSSPAIAAMTLGFWGRALLTVAIAFVCVIPFILVIAISMGQKIEGASWAARYRELKVQN